MHGHVNNNNITLLKNYLLDRGESKTVQRGKVSATAWQDRKVVTAMATNCQPSAVGEVQRRKLDGSRVTIPCPLAVLLYNRFMGGVDNGDQLRGYYECRKRSRKFYKYVYHFLFDVTITNSFILLRHFGRSVRMSLKEFRLKLASQLIGDYCSRCRPCRRPSAIRSLPLRHFPIKVNADNSAKRRRGRCAQCSSTKHARVDSSWYCRECDVWLCHTGDTATDCFLLWHTHINTS